MKKNVLFFALFFMSAFTTLNAHRIPLEKKYTTPTSIRPRAPMLIPLSVDVTSTDLLVNFSNTVGIANIQITDSNGCLVEQVSIDTYTENEYYFSFENMEKGEYSISIDYGNNGMSGSFTIE